MKKKTYYSSLGLWALFLFLSCRTVSEKDVEQSYREERWSVALDGYNKLLLKKPGNRAYLNNRGLIYKNLRRYRKALKDFNRIIEKEKKNNVPAEVYNNRGSVYKELKEYNKALGDFNRAIELKKDYGTAYFNRGNLLNEMQAFPLAEKDFLKARELLKDHALIDFSLAVFYHGQGDEKRALNFIDTALEKGLDSARGFELKGFLETEIGSADRGLKNYNKALERNPYSLPALRGRALILGNRGRWDEALADTVTLLRKKPRDRQGLLTLGMIKLNRDHPKDAIDIFQKMLKVYPESPDILNHLGEAYFILRDYLSATKYFIRSVEMKPGAPVYNNLGRLYSFVGEYKKALMQYERAVALAPENLTFRVNLALVKGKLGRYEEARRDLTTVRDALEKRKKENRPLSGSKITAEMIKQYLKLFQEKGRQEQENRGASNLAGFSPKSAP